MRDAILGLVVLVGALLACGVHQPVRGSFEQNGLDRAAYELGCPRSKLQLHGLNTPLDQLVELGSQIGVEGCGQRAVYVFTQTGWLLNSQSTTGK